jgi:hypothetical protein
MMLMKRGTHSLRLPCAPFRPQPMTTMRLPRMSHANASSRHSVTIFSTRLATFGSLVHWMRSAPIAPSMASRSPKPKASFRVFENRLKRSTVYVSMPRLVQ